MTDKMENSFIFSALDEKDIMENTRNHSLKKRSDMLFRYVLMGFWTFVILSTLFLAYRVYEMEKKLVVVNNLFFDTTKSQNNIYDVLTNFDEALITLKKSLRQDEDIIQELKKSLASTRTSLAANQKDTSNLRDAVSSTDKKSLSTAESLQKFSHLVDTVELNQAAYEKRLDEFSKLVGTIKLNQKELGLRLQGLEENILSIQKSIDDKPKN